MVYGAALEMRFGGNSIEGSNPSLSATISALIYHWLLRTSFAGAVGALVDGGTRTEARRLEIFNG